MTPFNTAVIASLQPKTPLTEFFSFKDAINRQHALDEGFLIDVSSLATKFFHVPVAMTREVWERCVAMNHTELFKQQFIVTSILCQAKAAIKHAKPHATEVSFDVQRFPGNTKTHLDQQRLWVVVSSGDQNESVLTLMLDSQHAEDS